MASIPVSYHQFPPDAFPIVLEFFKITDVDGTMPVHRIDVTGAGVTTVPALARQHGLVWVRVTSHNGAVLTERWPKGGNHAHR